MGRRRGREKRNMKMERERGKKTEMETRVTLLIFCQRRSLFDHPVDSRVFYMITVTDCS